MHADGRRVLTVISTAIPGDGADMRGSSGSMGMERTHILLHEQACMQRARERRTMPQIEAGETPALPRRKIAAWGNFAEQF